METIKLSVNTVYLIDLKEDFTMNETKDLYQFIDGDPVKAFHIGANIKEWFETLDPIKQYLYSKQLRHNKDDLEKYKEQIKFWAEKFPSKEADFLELSEFILNNMFWDEESEELDKVKLAIFFGQSLRAQIDKQNGEELT